MKLKSITFFFILLNITSFAQVRFDKGYFIDQSNQRIECLMRNYDGKNNPIDFEYKLLEGDASKTMDVSGVKEFGIGNESRYLSSDVQIDRSSQNLDELTTVSGPEWHKERLFLKVLVEGNATLLHYSSGRLDWYFYKTRDSIRQLVHKMFLLENGGTAENNKFRQQLMVDVNCHNNTTSTELKEIDYSKSDLIRYFKTYNQCMGGTSVEYLKPRGKGLFHLKITPGVSYTSIDLEDYHTSSAFPSKNAKFGRTFDFRLGLEAEYVLPYNKNKWSIVFEPAIQTYNSTAEANSKKFTATYNSLDLPLGIRHYFFLSPSSRLFVNGFLLERLTLNSAVDIGDDIVLKARSRLGWTFGLGIAVKRISLEARYNKTQDIFPDDVGWVGTYSRMTFILGFRVL